MRLYVGCAMWALNEWPGRHLPNDRHGQLAAYATWCNAVEANATFYAAPAASTVAGWAAQTTDDFRFLFKLPQEITHRRRLRVPAEEVLAVRELLAPLGRRASRLAVQLPASFGPAELPVLEIFLGSLRGTGRYAVEVRHPAFFDDPARLRDVLAAARAEWTIFDTTTLFASPPTSDAEREAWDRKPRLPWRAEALTDAPVVRFIGRDDPEATAAGWQRWIPIVAHWLAEGRKPTFFVHTPDNIDALPLARRFHAEVGAAVPGLEPLPEPHRPEREPTLF
jgi:uncharacterized protein YecE (DUF72 family)